MAAQVYLIPCYLLEGVNEVIPDYVLKCVKQCQVFFVENERTARRYLKSLWREMVIDDYQWHTIHKAEAEVQALFAGALRAAKVVGILSEAGCPGIADPGQLLVAKAQEMGVKVKPLVGPSSILLALMASGLNGQQFRFLGYLPIETAQRRKSIQLMEEIALKTGETQIFIETPYRNDALVKDILQYGQGQTQLCVAVDITGPDELIATKSIRAWKQSGFPPLHKRPAIYLIGRG